MASPFPNVWHLRKVASDAAKACYVCYKPSSSVLITPDNKDFFYVCVAHLKDRNFASPVVEEESEEAKKKRLLDAEIELVKKEYEEKQKKREAKKKAKKDGDDKDKEKDKSEDKSEKEIEKEKDEKIDALKAKSGTAGTTEDSMPRIYNLHKNFFKMRTDRIRNIEMAKRNQARLQNATAFPSVPKGDL